VNAQRRLVRAFGGIASAIMLTGLGGGPPAQAEPAGAATIDEAVRSALADDGSADVIIRLTEQADLSALAPATEVAQAALDEVRGLLGSVTGSVHDIVSELEGTARVAAVVDTLQSITETSAGDVGSLLAAKESAGQVRNLREYWIFNGFAATIDQATLDELAGHPDVASVTYDEVIELADTTTPASGFTELASLGLLAQEATWGVDRVRAPQVWERHGTTGEGVVVGILDSGVDGNHPELAEAWRGRSGDVAKSWFAATGEPYAKPGDRRGHGTHVTGSIVSHSYGVAPGAEWIAAKVFRDNGATNVSVIHAGMQWMMAPAGDPKAAPDVVNSSWGTSDARVAEFWQDLKAWEAAGIVPVFAVGNRGPRSGSLSSPASFPHVIAVGATDSQNQVARFSSRGPAMWNGVSLIKPDLVAPGVRIRSTSLRGGSRLMNGTSMAAPHVTGVIALMRSVKPNLTVEQIRDALEHTSRRGASGANDAFGYGLVDALGAVDRVADS
jgi:subtilisin family serine protease